MYLAFIFDLKFVRYFSHKTPISDPVSEQFRDCIRVLEYPALTLWDPRQCEFYDYFDRFPASMTHVLCCNKNVVISA